MRVLIIEPGIVNRAQKARMRKEGVEVVETDNPSAARFLSAAPLIDGNSMLSAAIKSIDDSFYDDVKIKFVKNLAKAVRQEHPDLLGDSK